MEQKIKKCPYCGEDIMVAAKKCKHCGEWLELSVDNAYKVSKMNANNSSGSERANKKSNSFIKKMAFVICSVIVSFIVVLLLINACVEFAFGGGEALNPNEDIISELKKYDITLGEQRYEAGDYKIQVTSASHNYDLHFKLLIKCEDGSSQYEEVYSDNGDYTGIKAGQTVWFTESVITEGDVANVQIVDAFIDGESVLKNAKNKEKANIMKDSENSISDDESESVWLGDLLEAGNNNIEDPVWEKRLVRLVGQDNYLFMCEQYMGTAIQKEDGMMGRYQSYTFSSSTKENWDDGYVINYSCGDGHENLEVEITRNGKAKTFEETN